MSEIVLVPPTRSGGSCYHQPATDDATHPRCGGDSLSDKDWRAVPAGHPATAFKRPCKQCQRREESDA